MELGPIIFDLEGTELSSEEHELLKNPLVGGVILFSRNFADVQQLLLLVKQIRACKAEALIMVDQEGGKVQRFKKDFTLLPSLRGLGIIYDCQSPQLAIDLAYQLGALMALEILSTGVDLSLAPVVDLDKALSEVIGNRAFHGNPQIVIDLARSYIQGMESAGMPATIKHFPGHGSVVLDSHLALPHDERKKQDIAVDMKPFAALAQDPNVRAVMPAHIVYDQLDDKPACFSKYWLQDVLRSELGFEGVIISDDLSMEGAASLGNYAQRAHAALGAGCDLILVCNNRTGLIDILASNLSMGSKESIQRRTKLKGAWNYDWASLREQKQWIEAEAGLKTFTQTLSKVETAQTAMR